MRSAGSTMGWGSCAFEVQRGWNLPAEIPVKPSKPGLSRAQVKGAPCLRVNLALAAYFWERGCRNWKAQCLVGIKTGIHRSGVQIRTQIHLLAPQQGFYWPGEGWGSGWAVFSNDLLKILSSNWAWLCLTVGMAHPAGLPHPTFTENLANTKN